MSDNDDGFDDFFDPYDGLSDLTGEENVPPLEEPAMPLASPPRSPLLTGLIVLLLLVVLTFAFFQLLRGDTPDDNTATGTSTTAGVEDDSSTTGGNGSTTTTEPAKTPSTVPDSAFDPYVSRGQAVALADLKLQVDAIGPITLGSPANQAIGQLIASLGDPTDDTGPIVSTGAFGACAGRSVRIVRWGALAAVVVIDDDGTETFGGYRVDLNYEGALGHVTADLQTLSGLQAGASVREINIVYKSFDTRIVVDADLGDVFEVKSANTGALLLWGPVTSSEPDGRIDGIYAPNACTRFQS